MRAGSIFLNWLWLLAWALPTGAERIPARPASPRTPAQARLTIRISHLFNGKPLRMDNTSLRNQAGNTLSVSRLAYFISEVTLLKANGGTIALPNQAAYLNPAEGRETFSLPPVPAGRYTGISFHIGLPSKTNHADPYRYPAGHPLHPLVNRLHWGWQGGYVFLALEGRYAQTNGKWGGYSYHLAMDQNLMTVRLVHIFQVEQGSTLNLAFDVAKAFAAVNPILIQPTNGSDSTHSAPGDKLAARLKANIQKAFQVALTPTPLSQNVIQKRSSNAEHGERANAGISRMAEPLSTPNTPVNPIAAALCSHLTPYLFPTPAHFPQPRLPADNPLTAQGIALGKKLFFELKLSGNNTQSCANCHQPEHAFADAGKSVSIGIDGKPGTRRALTLFNLAWQSAFTWDGRRTRLRDQALAPIQDVREMHQSLSQAVAKLQADPQYPVLFAGAFGNSNNKAKNSNIKVSVSAGRVGLALEQYLLTLVAADAKFDRALRGEAQFTDEEKRGLLLFITEYDPARGIKGADCFHCHGSNLFTDYQFRNNGLDTQTLYAATGERIKKPGDVGRFLVTGREADRGKFKTPSLRNVELTAPYMHDGRFRTLEDVVHHYNAGVRRSDTLDPNLAKHPENGMALSEEDVRALVAFLKTLTDTKLSLH